jgi:ATP-binding cassette subfamily F protein 3
MSGLKNCEDEGPKILDKTVNFSDISKNQISKQEREAMDKMWGFDTIRQKVNDTMSVSDSAGNAKSDRKTNKDDQTWLSAVEAEFIGDEEDGSQISTMLLPDFSGNSNEKDIHVHNFNITFGGRLLLENADLRLVYGRRYGLIGR